MALHSADNAPPAGPQKSTSAVLPAVLINHGL
jgi:hypothetical protein